LLDGEEELRTRYGQIVYGSMGFSFEKDADAFKSEFVPKFLTIFEKVLATNNTGFLVGNKVIQFKVLNSFL
jgi:hypothetical protein